MEPDIRSGKLWVEQPPTRTTPLVSVAPVAPVDRVYTFTVDPQRLKSLKPGRRVAVPIGKNNRMTPGFIVDIQEGPWSSTLKPIGEILDPAGQLSRHLIELGRWISRYYQCPLGRTLAAMTPTAARRLSGFRPVRYVQCTPRPPGGETAERHEVRGKKQKAVLDLLAKLEQPVATEMLLKRAGASRATLRSLIAGGQVVETIRREPPPPPVAPPLSEPDFELSGDQHHALERIGAIIDARRFRAVLLYGVSGSGKTEVYVRAIRRAIATGRQAVMMVPEIALTTQLVQRLMRRFERVAVIHSGLSDANRGVMWERIRRGEVDVVIGTRSAVFAPCPDPGLWVVDEEQETSYKNLQRPRFHVRDVAIKRAHMLNVPIVLGSATPSLELWYNAMHHDDYERIDLPRRVNHRPLPTVQVVDMREEITRPGGGPPVLSRRLLGELDAVMKRGEQAVLLLNRRGYAQWLQCAACGHRLRCPRCNVQMVLHRSRAVVVCHHCQHRVRVPDRCPDPSCGGALVRRGCGTERLEQVLASLLPSARVRRADSDTMRRGDHYRELVRGFESGDFDILLGTQMIAKGLDFPNVSLVGVIGAEQAGAGYDFRAGERLFQLITQVAGRAGRGDLAGWVVVQSLDPQLPALRFATGHDYGGFAEAELKRRAKLGLPPYRRMTRVVVSAKTERTVREQSKALAERFRELTADKALTVDWLGPHPCAMERRRDQYRYELLIRTASAATMTGLLEAARQDRVLNLRGASVVVDVDPVNMT